MMLLIGLGGVLLGALVGATVGGLSALLTDHVRARRDLRHGYDRDLRARRIDSFARLFRHAGTMPRYRPASPHRAALPSWADGLQDWYFDDAGGLFMSGDAHRRFLDLLDVLKDVAADATHGPRLVEAEVDLVWRAGEALRRQLAADLGGELPGVLPPESPRTPRPRQEARALQFHDIT